jgi:hypothetical protein
MSDATKVQQFSLCLAARCGACDAKTDPGVCRVVHDGEVALFEALSTPKEPKTHVLFDGGHVVPNTSVLKEIPDWLDRYFGPVQ